MARMTLLRVSDDGLRTRGRLFANPGDGFTPAFYFYTLEEPWKDNQVGHSCIPCGTYHCVPHGWRVGASVHQKKCWQLLGTAPRSGILIHSGNTVNDICGCILVGLKEGVLHGLDAVLDSQRAMNMLRGIVGQREFELEIKEARDDRHLKLAA